MKVLKLFLPAALGMIVATSALADVKPIACNDFRGISNVKKQIMSLDKKFAWNSPTCKIVGTQSIFARNDKSGKIEFANGLQLFFYQGSQLKFICLPGWVCKPW